MTSSLIRVEVRSQRGGLSLEQLHSLFPSTKHEFPGIEFVSAGETQADVCLVLNYLRYDQDITAREGYIWKWDNEPIVRLPFPKGFDRVYTHVQGSADPRVINAPPILDWWVGRTFEELEQLGPPRKTKRISAIASTKTLIEGHRRRTEFVDSVSHQLSDVDVFGQGRALELKDKWDGLAPYRFSIAIENSSTPDYWTEKITDCFLTYTVPLYFGAPNIGQYFPEESFVWLPIDDPARAIELIDSTVSNHNWEQRLAALEEARRRVLNLYSFGAQISSRVNAERDKILGARVTTRRVHGRRTKPGGWIRGAGVTGNLSAWWKKREARRESHGASED